MRGGVEVSAGSGGRTDRREAIRFNSRRARDENDDWANDATGDSSRAHRPLVRDACLRGVSPLLARVALQPPVPVALRGAKLRLRGLPARALDARLLLRGRLLRRLRLGRLRRRRRLVRPAHGHDLRGVEAVREPRLGGRADGRFRHASGHRARVVRTTTSDALWRSDRARARGKRTIACASERPSAFNRR